MNKIIMMGRLTRDPEVRSAGTTLVAKFSLAVNRKYKKEGEPEADFFNCIAFGKQAEFVEKYLHKGIKMLISGRIQNNNYTNRDGQKVYSVQIIVEELDFAESRSSQQSNSNNSNFSFKGSPAQSPMPADSFYADADFMTIPDDLDDLPFGRS